ncbi:hypothetical protein J6590_011351 [Homalodisca vitripennis]|nr:hypothetical protein J6590_011351 [Homalodisca vitripennis]
MARALPHQPSQIIPALANKIGLIKTRYFCLTSKQALMNCLNGCYITSPYFCISPHPPLPRAHSDGNQFLRKELRQVFRNLGIKMVKRTKISGIWIRVRDSANHVCDFRFISTIDLVILVLFYKILAEASNP